jgi:hypothetical protein
MALFSIRLALRDWTKALGRALFKPAWIWLANYRITLLESELYRLDSMGPFSEEQFGRVKSAIGASEAHLRELNERVAYLESCRRDGVKPRDGLHYADIAHWAEVSRKQLVSAITPRRHKPTGRAVVRVL